MNILLFGTARCKVVEGFQLSFSAKLDYLWCYNFLGVCCFVTLPEIT